MEDERVHWTSALQAKLLPRRPAGGVATSRVRPRALVMEIEDIAADILRIGAVGEYEHLGLLKELRRLVATVDDAGYVEVHAAALALMASPSPSVRCAIAFLFPNEPAWARAEAEVALASQAPPLAADLLFDSLDDVDLLTRLADACVAARHVHGVSALSSHALELLATLGSRATPILLKVLAAAEKAKKPKRDITRCLDALELVHTPEVASIFAERLASPATRGTAASFFRAAPELALEALPPVAKGKGKTAEAARTLLAGLAPVAPAVTTSADAVAKEAPLSALPRVLAKPPWRTKSAKSLTVIENEMVLDVKLPVDPVLHAKDTWATKIHWVPNAIVFSPRVALPVAHAWVHRKEDRPAAEAWLTAFPEIAAIGLVPAAVREPSASRTDAGRMLRRLASQAPEAVASAVARYDEAVRLAVAEVLALDPVEDCPHGPPKLPELVRIASLPRPRLAATGEVLSEVALRNLVEMLAFSSSDFPYAGIAHVKAVCDPRSLEELAWAIFSAWLAEGAPPRGSWALEQLGDLGGDDVARRLAPKVRAWPQERASARAEAGVDVLARIGTDVALMHLTDIAERSRYQDLAAKARARVGEVAARRGLTMAELGDRLVPDLGLDASGSKTLSFGARTFTIGFDEHLSPFVRDASGAVATTLPRPNSKDDAESAKAAQEAWKALKDDLSSVARGQIARFEQAMSTSRRWTAADFEGLFVKHALLVHLVRRLVWGVYEGDALVTTFRVAEDRTFADATDTPFTLPHGEKLAIGIPHPLELPDDLQRAWGGVLADYELLQPFAQLGRETFTMTDEESKAEHLGRFNGSMVESAKLFSLDYRGWRRDRGQVVQGFDKLVRSRDGTCDLTVSLGVSPGFMVATPTDPPEQSLDGLWLRDSRGQPRVFGVLAPIVFSELVRDVETLRA
jgi:hypothetical protein